MAIAITTSYCPGIVGVMAARTNGCKVCLYIE